MKKLLATIGILLSCCVLFAGCESPDDHFQLGGMRRYITRLKDYIVADTGDVLLVCPLSEEQKLRQVVNDVKMLYGEKYL